MPQRKLTAPGVGKQNRGPSQAAAKSPLMRSAGNAMNHGRGSWSPQQKTPPRALVRAVRLRFMERVTLWLSFAPLLLTCLVPKAWIGLPAGVWLLLFGTWMMLNGARDFIERQAIIELERVRGRQARLVGLVELIFGAGAILLGLASLAATLAPVVHLH